jgi:hypothetical protein
VTNSNKRFALAYVLLVALPVVGLAGVLRSGRKLSAPVSVNGAWRLSFSGDQLAGFSCGKLLPAQNAALAISQSGTEFTLNVPNSGLAAASGTVEENRIYATLIPTAKDAACAGHSLGLTATVDIKASPRSMQGALGVQDCPGCAAVEFRGIREEQAKSKETH